MNTTIDQPHLQHAVSWPIGQAALSAMDSLSQGSALEGQLNVPSTRQRLSELNLEHKNASKSSSSISLTSYVKEARATLSELLERERRTTRDQKDRQALQWLAKNRRNYPGHWLALDGCELLATGTTARQVYDRVHESHPDALIVEVELEDLPFAGL